jgi:hypothetical protein
MGRKSETNERLFLPAPSSHLHALPQVPEHADRIERIDGTRTRSTGVVVLKVERRRHTQFDLFVFLILLRASVPRHGTSSPFSLSRWGIACCVLCGWNAAAVACACCPPSSRTFSASAVAAAAAILAFLITSENDIEEDGGSGSGGHCWPCYPPAVAPESC